MTEKYEKFRIKGQFYDGENWYDCFIEILVDRNGKVEEVRGVR